ncbi:MULTISPECIES: helix-turn-helix domain-containing protein [unclassified Bacillus (in: firmicutes)]|uniref:helix-turn-helix domain-containing protein n=1 Tax=Bacillaceae TaxID=186817 RepID=UPI0004E275D4|nr:MULTISPECIES: helix-turn-helix transcriptional regulator [unclassified Bacillus (in: firmicutes)]REB76428.1 XRE family transcriptional regulator [Cutibacterium acnes]CAI9391347.1 hypothetical protein BACSP_02973 [Bacillus sp. T2.9-1]
MRSDFQLYGKALKMIRLSKNLKAVEVAKNLNVTKQYISNCETGRRKLSATKTKQFLELVGISEEQAKAFVQIIEN